MNQSSWGQDIDLERPSAESLRRGHFVIGNGLIFASLGYGEQASTLQGIRLTRRSSSKREDRLTLSIDGVPIYLPSQRLRRVRGANFVLSDDRGPDLSLVTLNFAEPGREHITRVISVRNLTKQRIGRLTLSSNRGPVGGWGQFALDPGESREYTLGQSLDEVRQSAVATWQWWQRKLSTTTTYDTDHVKLRDLIADWKINLLVLNDRGEDGPRGGVLLLLLRFGLMEEAHQLLEQRMESNSEPLWNLLEHYWYWRASGDLDLIEEHWHALRSGLESESRASLGRTLRQATLALLACQCGGVLAGRLGHGEVEATYLAKSHELMAQSEDLLWLEAEGHFAPGLDANGMPIRNHQASQNYFPLWAGWTFASGRRSRRNLENSMKGIGTQQRGEIPGMLLAALTEQNKPERSEVIGKLIQEEMHRGSFNPAVSGINLDAILFAITGLRYAAVPGFAEDSLRLQLMLPEGTNHFTVKGARQNGWVFNLYLRKAGKELVFDLALVSVINEGIGTIPVAVRNGGDTHLGWLWDAPDHFDASGLRITPRQFSGRSAYLR